MVVDSVVEAVDEAAALVRAVVVLSVQVGAQVIAHREVQLLLLRAVVEVAMVKVLLVPAALEVQGLVRVIHWDGLQSRAFRPISIDPAQSSIRLALTSAMDITTRQAGECTSITSGII